MGKYQNVGTPRFYVDYFQWLLATRQVRADGNGFLGRYSSYDPENQYEAQDMLFAQPYAFRPELTKMFYLDPTNQTSFIVNASVMGNTSGTLGYESDLSISLEMPSDDYYNINYGMVLNHNFKATNTKFLFKQYNGRTDTSFSSTGLDRVNWESNEVEYNGWSFYESNPDVSTAGIQTINMRLINDTEETIRIGAVSIGRKYDMPQSPNLDLTMTREFGGAKKQWTSSGRLLTNYNYTQPPLWGDGEAWGLYDSKEDNLEARRAGRRTWDLKFSYLSDSDIMADLEMLNIYPDEENNNPDGYDMSLSDNTFFSQFMQKTLGGSLRFIFQPDNTDFNPDSFAICTLNQDSISIKQVAHNTYNIDLKIMEVW